MIAMGASEIGWVLTPQRVGVGLSGGSCRGFYPNNQYPNTVNTTTANTGRRTR